VITTSPNSRHERLYGWRIYFAESIKEWVLTLNILAQVLVDYHFQVCQLIQSRIVQAIISYNNIHQVPSITGNNGQLIK
jgi:hypothetical protein